MINKSLFIKYISIALVVWTVLGCRGGFDSTSIPVPDDVLADARSAAIKDDITGIVNDYAQIDTGAILPDGFTVTKPTDAERILTMATNTGGHIFIELPNSPEKAEHTLRSLRAASIRLGLNQSTEWSFQSLNVAALKGIINTYNLSVAETKAYLLQVAEIINKKVSAKHIVLVDVDELAFSVTPQEFFKVVTTPHIIAVSKHDIDRFDPFWPQDRQEFQALGLDPGHIFQLTAMRLKRAKSKPSDVVINDLSLHLAKLITALAPQAGLGQVAQFYKALSPLIEQAALAPDIKDQISKLSVPVLEANYQFVRELNLDQKTLTQLHQQVSDNRKAFIEQAFKTDDIQKMMKALHATPPQWGSEVVRGVDKVRSQLADLRSQDLPAIQRELMDKADENRDDIIAGTKKEVRDAGAKIMAETKKYHDDTRSDTERIVKRAKAEINDTTDMVGKDIARSLAADLDGVRTALTERFIKALLETQSNLKTDAGVRHDETRQAIKKGMAQTVGDAQSSINDQALANTESIKALVSDSVQKALRALLANQKDSTKDISDGINNTTQAVVAKARQILQDALADAETGLKKQLVDEHGATRDVLKRDVHKGLAQTETNLKADAGVRHDETRQAIKKGVAQTVGDAQNSINDQAHANSEGIKALVSDSVQKALRALLANQRDSTKDISDGINNTTQAVVAKARQILQDALADAESGLKKQLVDEHGATRDVLKRDVHKGLAQTEANLKTDAGVRHDETRQVIKKGVAQTVGDAQSSINDQAHANSESIKALVSDSVQKALRALLANQKDSTKDISDGINNTTQAVVAKARQILQDALADAESGLKKQMVDEHGATRDVLKRDVQKGLAQTETNLKADAGVRHDETRQVIKKGVVQTVGDAQSSINDRAHANSEGIKALVSDSVQKALRALLANQRDSTKDISDGINNTTQAVVAKARQILQDALADAETGLKKQLAEEHGATRDVHKRDVHKGLAQAETNLKADAGVRHDETRQVIKKGVVQTVGDAQSSINDQAHANSEGIKALVSDSVQKALRALLANQKDSTKDISDGINNTTQAVVAKARQILQDALADAESGLKKQMVDEHGATRDVLKRDVQKGLAQTETNLKADAGVRHDETRQVIKKHNEQMAQATQEAVNKEIENKIMGLSQTINDRVNQAVAHIIKTSQEQAQDIKGSTETLVKKEHRLTKEEITSAKEDVKKIVAEEVERTLVEIARLPSKNRLHTAAIARMIGDYIIIPFMQNINGTLRRGLKVDNNNDIVARVYPPGHAQAGNPVIPEHTAARIQQFLQRIQNAPRADIQLNNEDGDSLETLEENKNGSD